MAHRLKLKLKLKKLLIVIVRYQKSEKYSSRMVKGGLTFPASLGSRGGGVKEN